MRILFLKTGIGASYVAFFDLGVASIAAVLKNAGHEVSYLFVEEWDNLDLLKKRIEVYKPDMVGVSVTAATFWSSDKLVGEIKKINKNIFCFCGGIHTTVSPIDFVNSDNFDAACLGEGEYSVLELANKYKTNNYFDVEGFWFKKNKKIIKNKKRSLIKNLDELPFVETEMFAKEGRLYEPVLDSEGKFKRKIDFIFSRGCPFDCNYCSNTALKKFYGCNFVRSQSAKRSIEQINQVKSSYGVDYFTFHDDIFTLDRKWLKEFLAKYKKEIGLPFECNLRVGVNCDEEMISLLKESGCFRVKIGLESGSDRVRQKILNRKMKNQDIVDTFKRFRQHKIKSMAFVMMGFPDETISEFLETVNLVSKVNPDSYELYIFYPYLGTKLYDYCKKYKLLDKKISLHSVVERKEPVLNLKTFKKQDVIYFFNNFAMMVNFGVGTNSRNLMAKFYRKFCYFLYKIPPSKKVRFIICQFLLISLRCLAVYFNGLYKLFFTNSRVYLK